MLGRRSAGGDLPWVRCLHDDESLREATQEEAGDILFEMIRFPLPVIAAVNGPAVGLGCSVAVMADVSLIADSAFLADPHVSIGLVAGDGGAAMWPLLTNILRAREYLFTGDRIPAPVAVELGLATRVVALSELMNEARRLADEVLAQPRYTLAEAKDCEPLSRSGHDRRSADGLCH